MPSPVPTPIAAVIGIVPAVVSHARRLPGKAVQLPIVAVSSALTVLDTARREYADLAERGERLLARLRGTSLDELEDTVEDAVAATPFAGAYDAVEDALDAARTQVGKQAAGAAERVGEQAAGAAERVGEQAAGAAVRAGEQAAGAAVRAGEQAADTAERVGDRVEDAADAVVGTARDAAQAGAAAAAKSAGRADGPRQAGAHGAAPAPIGSGDIGADAQAPKGEATPKATEPDRTRVDSAATPEVVDVADAVSAFSDVPAVASHDELPLPDYDHMTLGSLRGRLRSLDVAQLVQLRDYEKAHADRLPVVTMLDNRIAKLATDAATTPSPGGAGGQPTATGTGRGKVEGPSGARTGGVPHTKVRTT